MDDAKKQALQEIYNKATLKSMGSDAYGTRMDLIFLAMEMCGEEEAKKKDLIIAEREKSIQLLMDDINAIQQKRADEIAALQHELAESKKNKARTHNSEVLDEFFYESECKKLREQLSQMSAAVIEYVDADGSMSHDKMLKLAIDNTPEPTE